MTEELDELEKLLLDMYIGVVDCPVDIRMQGMTAVAKWKAAQITQAGWVQLAPDQSLPNKFVYGGNQMSAHYNTGYTNAQQDMLKAGFKKIKR